MSKMSNLHQQLQIFLYKNKLNEKSIMDLLPKFNNSTIKSIINDLGILEQLPEISDDLYIFSDGNCKGNGKKHARAGYSVFFTDNIESPHYRFNKTRFVATEPTNNKAELSGIKYAIKTISQNIDLFKDTRNIICTDSMYSINCIEKWSKSWIKNGWKNSKGEEVKNKELIQEIIDIKTSIPENIKISFKHVYGHTKEPSDKTSLEYKLWYGNNKVDSNINELMSITNN